VQEGALRIANGANRLPTSTTVTLGSAGATGTLYLGLTTTPRNQQVAALSSTGMGGSVVNGASTAATSATLTVSGTISTAFGGTLGGPNANENNLLLTKASTGTLTLTGTNTYTGTTTISGGALRALDNGLQLGTGNLTLSGGVLENPTNFTR